MLPILYQSNDFILYSYPLFMGLGWGVGYQIFFELLPSTFERWKAQLLFWGLFLFSWLGAKILFLYTVPEQISASLITESSFWLGGGFVFYGGLLGGIFFLAILKGMKFPITTDLLWMLVPPLTIGHAIGRFGCFLAGCCYGKETELFWGIYLHGAKRHPTQLLECVLLLSLGIFLLRSRLPKRTLVSIYFVFYGLIRLWIEFLRGDAIRGQWGSLTPSQWISLVLVLAGITVFIYKNKALQRTY
jgi:phosphatidylglycerol:prolipoprotein diacylglycerol transferase